MSLSEIINTVFESQMNAISELNKVHIDTVTTVIDLINDIEGKVICCGIGKSGIVARKMVSTLNSIGTPALFLHSGDALHGDIGVVQSNDCLITISKSGNSAELGAIYDVIKHLDIQSIAIHSNLDCVESSKFEHQIFVPVCDESDKTKLAPTNSILLHLAVCDAIAIGLQYKKGLNESDFARVHPHGNLGKRLTTRVEDLISIDRKPEVHLSTAFKDVVYEISSKRYGACAVTENEQVLGIITDGDIRRLLMKNLDLSNVIAKDVMSLTPKTITTRSLAKEGLEIMKKYNITQLITVDDKHSYQGILHLHDILDLGIY